MASNNSPVPTLANVMDKLLEVEQLSRYQSDSVLALLESDTDMHHDTIMGLRLYARWLNTNIGELKAMLNSLRQSQIS